MHYHLAQVNVARMLAPLDSPQLAPFVARLEEVNAEADRAAGFVWRLRDVFTDPLTLFNFRVWRSAEALQEYTCRPGHVELFREWAQWVEWPTSARLAMWWVPAGHIPTLEEALERLMFRERCGDTEAAFAKPFPAPEAPESEPGALPVNLDGRTFVTASNTANGDADSSTRFTYRQEGSRVWATYRGGRVRFGSLTAVADRAGRLDMRYLHAGVDDAVRTGRCVSTPEVLADGRVRLHEQWQWTNGDQSSGQSVLEEVGHR